MNEKSENHNEIVLNSLRIRNLNKLVVGHFNFYSVRNKFDFLAYQVKENINVLMISETELDESFPLVRFSLDGYGVPFQFDRNGNGGGILLDIKGRYTIQIFEQKHRGFFRKN